MDFRYSDEQDMMRRLARDFAEKEIVPYAGAWEEKHVFPLATLNRMRAAGLLTLGIPAAYGGAGLDHVSKNLVTEELARGDAGIATIMVVSTLLGSHPVWLAATHEQKKWWYGLEAEGSLTALCLGGEVSCHRRGDEYILNGRRQSVNNGAEAGLYTVFASLDHRPGARGTCTFMVDRNSDGIWIESVSPPGVRSSESATVSYDDVRVPARNLLGQEGDGVKIAVRTQSMARVTAAAVAVGVAQATFEAVVQYSLQRYQFGKPIFELPEIHLRLVDMAQLIETGRLSHLATAKMLDDGLAADEVIYQTRGLCSDIALRATRDALWIFGGPGYVQEVPVEKYYRDALLLRNWREQPWLKKHLSPAI